MILGLKSAGKYQKNGLKDIALNMNYFQSDTDDLITRIYYQGYWKSGKYFKCKDQRY